MKHRRFRPAEIAYEYQIGYSQGVILGDLLLGFFLLIGGVALSLWIKSWLGLFWSLLGMFSIWQAIKRFRQQGPQLKIGRQGVWSVKTNFLPWGRVLPLVKLEAGYRSVSTYLILFNRLNQRQEIARFNMRELDIDARVLNAYIKEFAPKLQ